MPLRQAGLLAVALALVAGCRPAPPPPPPPIDVVLCLAGQPDSLLAFVAADRGYFAAEGLRVGIKPYVSGKRALAAMLAGEGDLATTADVPVVFESFAGTNFRILAQICTTTRPACIVANRDAGIAAPGDLRGKRIATQQGSAVHFFLHMFLLKHGLGEPDVAVSFMPAEALPDALVEGRIDAFSMREPYVTQARERLGERALVFDAPGLYYRAELLVASPALLRSRPQAPERALRALIRAERFARDKPADVARILAAALEIEPRRAAGEAAVRTARVVLDQALLLGLEDEAAWARRNGLVEAAGTPNFLRMIEAGPLGRVRPGSVTLLPGNDR